MNTKFICAAVVAAAGTFGLTGVALAQAVAPATAAAASAPKGSFEHSAAKQAREDHPREAEVDGRMVKQDQRIHKEVKEGEMTKAQAKQLRAEQRAVRKQERAMAAEHGGHITKKDQRELNKEENAVSKQIGK